MPEGAPPPDLSIDSRLRELRRRADEDFLSPPQQHQEGRHTLDVPELRLRVSMTRSRYPNRDDGVDQYAVTISRLEPGEPPEEGPTWRVLYAAFGEGANHAAARPGGPAVRMFRVPVTATTIDPGTPVPQVDDEGGTGPA